MSGKDILTLDFWKDTVTYAGQAVPVGALACEALNISFERIGEIAQTALLLNACIAAIAAESITPELIRSTKPSAVNMVSLLKQTPPFDRMDYSVYIDGYTEDAVQNAMEYIIAAKKQGMGAALNKQYRRGVGIVSLIQTFAQLPASLTMYQQVITPFAEVLQGSKHTPDGYAAAFAEYFPNATVLLPDDPTWMSLTNVTAQYVSAIVPEKETAQLVKRMHYVSYVGMLRSDLFEGLCVGHAPRKCGICGRWFLTTNAAQTKYCGGYAPSDPKGRTCRQVAAWHNRAAAERADDHPIKAICDKRLNTIIQSVRRGNLDKELAAAMKRLAQQKKERAISNPAYAGGAYAAEMEQNTLMNEAKKALGRE